MIKKRKVDKKRSNSHRYAPNQEKKLVKEFSGKAVAGSGCGYKEGDVELGDLLLIEAKCTRNKSYALDRRLVEKLQAYTLQRGQIPAIQLDFITGDSPDHELLIMPKWVLELLLGK